MCVCVYSTYLTLLIWCNNSLPKLLYKVSFFLLCVGRLVTNFHVHPASYCFIRKATCRNSLPMVLSTLHFAVAPVILSGLVSLTEAGNLYQTMSSFSLHTVTDSHPITAFLKCVCSFSKDCFLFYSALYRRSTVSFVSTLFALRPIVEVRKILNVLHMQL